MSLCVVLIRCQTLFEIIYINQFFVNSFVWSEWMQTSYSLWLINMLLFVRCFVIWYSVDKLTIKKPRCLFQRAMAMLCCQHCKIEFNSNLTSYCMLAYQLNSKNKTEKSLNYFLLSGNGKLELSHILVPNNILLSWIIHCILLLTVSLCDNVVWKKSMLFNPFVLTETTCTNKCRENSGKKNVVKMLNWDYLMLYLH